MTVKVKVLLVSFRHSDNDHIDYYDGEYCDNYGEDYYMMMMLLHPVRGKVLWASVGHLAQSQPTADTSVLSSSRSS